jgi:hypothetical protein
LTYRLTPLGVGEIALFPGRRMRGMVGFLGRVSNRA